MVFFWKVVLEAEDGLYMFNDAMYFVLLLIKHMEYSLFANTCTSDDANRLELEDTGEDTHRM